MRTELLALKTRFGLLPNEPVLPVSVGSTLTSLDTPPATTSYHPSHKKPRNSESSAGSSQQHQFPSQIQLHSPLQFTTGDQLPLQMPPAPDLKAIPISVTVPKMLSEHVSSQWSSLPVSGTRSTPAVAIASVHPISLATLSTLPLAIVAPAQASQAGRAHPHAFAPAISPNGAALPLLQANALSQLPVTVAAMQLQPPPLHPLPRDRPREDELEERMLELEDDLEVELEPATSDEHEAFEGAQAQASPVSAVPLVNNSLMQLVSSLQQQPNVLTSLLLLAAQQSSSATSSSGSGTGAPDMSLLPLLLLAQSPGSSSDSLLSALLTLRSATGTGGAQSASSVASAAQSAPSASSNSASASGASGNSSANLNSAVKMLAALLAGVRPASDREEKYLEQRPRCMHH